MTIHIISQPAFRGMYFLSRRLHPPAIMLAFRRLLRCVMNQRLSGFVPLVFLFVFVANVPGLARSAEPQVKILSPTNDSRITQDQNLIFVSGKVAREAGRSANVD